MSVYYRPMHVCLPTVCMHRLCMFMYVCVYIYKYRCVHVHVGLDLYDFCIHLCMHLYVGLDLCMSWCLNGRYPVIKIFRAYIAALASLLHYRAWHI